MSANRTKNDPKNEARPHWTEELPSGELVFCVKERRHGKKTIHRYTFRELAEILNQAAAEKEAQI